MCVVNCGTLLSALITTFRCWVSGSVIKINNGEELTEPLRLNDLNGGVHFILLRFKVCLLTLFSLPPLLITITLDLDAAVTSR